MKTKSTSAFSLQPLTFVAVAALALSAVTAHANLLINPGFESGLTGWAQFWYASPATDHPFSGTSALKLRGNGLTAGNAAGVYQTLPARPGQRWTLSGWGLNAPDDPLQGQNYALLKIVWFSGPDGTGEELQPLPGPGGVFGANPGIDSEQLTSSTPFAWTHFSASGVAPSGTMSVRLFILFLQPNTSDAGSAWFDDLVASATPVWGIWDHALSLDGTDDYVNVPGNNWFGNAFTIEAWVYVRSHNNWARVLDFANGAPLDNVVLALSDGMSGRPAFQAYAGATWQGITAPTPIPPRQWVHLAATLSNNVAVLYVNGLPVAAADNWTALTPVWRTNNFIGRSAWSWDGYANAVFDDVRIWGVARSAEEIQADLNHPLTGHEPGLVAYAKCDEGSGTNLLDTVSQGSGSLVNGPEWVASTIPLWGTALSFDGLDDFVWVGTAPLANASFTLEAWARRDSSGTMDMILAQGMGAPYQGLMFGFHWGGFVLSFYGDGALSANVDNAWHHWAGTFDASTREQRLYRDGVLVATHIAGAAYQGFGPLHIGAEPFDDPAYFHGAIDDVRIWNKARSQVEIAADMLHPLTGSEPNLAHYWSFDDADDLMVRDATTNHFDGYLGGGVRPVGSTVSAPNLAVNPGFENGTDAWWGFDWATLTATNAMTHNGSYSGLVSDRTNTWSGVAQSQLGVLQPGIKYNISGWARLANSASGPVLLTFQKTDGEDTTYRAVASGTATSNQWTQLTGSYTLSVTGTLNVLTLYGEGPNPGTNFYVDDFVIAPDMAAVPLASAATTLPPTNLLNDAAAFIGTVNPNGLPTTAWFEWGTRRVYDHATAPVAVGNGWDNLSVSNAVAGLTPGLIYHYRLVASNGVGVARGTSQMFWSPALRLNSPDPLTNECHVAFADPATVNASPLAIATGRWHNLALRADGTVVGWGANYSGQTNVPADATNVVAIAAGTYHSLALKTDGTIAGWGSSDYGESSGVPAGSNVVAMAGNYVHTLALHADGTVVGWGRNEYGQATGIPGSMSATGVVTVAGEVLNGIVAIAAGEWHALGLRADGTVVGWGANYEGQANGAFAGSNVVAIAAGVDNSLALKSDGSVVGWGDNYSGQTNIPASATGVVAIATSSMHCLALRTDGTVVGWGANYSGQATGIPNTNPPFASAGLVTIGGQTLDNVVAIAAGDDHSLALKADGSIVGWGNNLYGKTTTPAGLDTLDLPISVSGTVDTSTPGSYVLAYSVTNGLGAVATANRTVVVADTLPPELTLLGANPLMLELGVPFTDPGAAATDLCAGDLTANILFNNTVNPTVAGAYTNTFTATDAGGNMSATNRLVLVVTRPVLTGLEHLSDGAFRFTFASTPGARFNVLTTTNLALPASEWIALGPATENPPGQFQFTDVNATNQPQRFYRLSWP